MNVLSLFDGISCGQLALRRAGISVDHYYASETDPHAIKITQKHFPSTTQLGDVEDWRDWDIDWSEIDLLVGGSPCQSFSIAGDRLNFDDPRGKLFFVFVDILNHIRKHNPDVKFLLENVKMKQEYLDIITRYLEVSPVKINSSLVSAQHRERMYWANWEFTQPLDQGILLEDILGEEFYPVSYKGRLYMDRTVKGGRDHWDFKHHSDTDDGKSHAVVANFYKGVPYNVLIDRRYASCGMWSCDFQDNKEMCVDCFENDCYQGEQYPTTVVRHFTPEECERLQTLPTGYTQGTSKTNRLKCIGNGWTVNVIAHILEGLKVAHGGAHNVHTVERKPNV